MAPCVSRDLDANDAQCLVFTEKEGLLSSAAHDLKLRVERFRARIDGGAIEATFDATTVRVVCARRGDEELPGVLSPRDRAEIERNIAGKVLQTGRYPSIRFRSTAVQAGPGGFRIDGMLELRGRERPVMVLARKEGDHIVAECAVHQPDFGIQPFTALLGALKVKPGVMVRIIAPANVLPASGPGAGP
jgi:hypothetical protein